MGTNEGKNTMRPVTLTVALDAASVTKVALAQTTAGAANLTLTASAAAIDSSGAARVLLITTGEDNSTVDYIIVGTDADGNSITETAKLPNHTTLASLKSYASVTSFHVSAIIGANMSVGTRGTTTSAVSKTIPLEFYSRTGATVAIEITGTANVSVQETFDDILGLGTANAVWFAPTALASKSSNTVGSLDIGATGCDLLINTYSTGASVTLRIISVESDKG